MLRIHALLHVPFEGLGHIAHWIASRGHQLTTTRFFEAHRLPSPDQFDRLIIMGGSMNIYQDRKYPWLASERGFIREVISCGKSVVGICLGAQLIADALGSPVSAGKEKEIGLHSLSLHHSRQARFKRQYRLRAIRRLPVPQACHDIAPET